MIATNVSRATTPGHGSKFKSKTSYRKFYDQSAGCYHGECVHWSKCDHYNDGSVEKMDMGIRKTRNCKYTKRYLHPVSGKQLHELHNFQVNCQDLNMHRIVSQREIEEWAQLQEHPYLRVIEASMQNGYGIKNIISFFNMPFLRYVIQRNVSISSDYKEV